MTDEDLARKSQAGSLAAFEELVHRYENRIYSFIFHSGGHDADAREAAQDTFVRAFAAIAQFDPTRSFAAWLFAIARRKAIDCYRARIPSGGGEPPEEADPDDPAELLARREEARELWRRARQSLPDSQFQALWLRYAEEMDLGQIARVLGKTQTHVKVLLFRARQKLAAELQSASPPLTLSINGAIL
ncbi:MAG TPA: sigma-70 family RNA polymerase sigma factor [Verrucomicrobiae bacterium]